MKWVKQAVLSLSLVVISTQLIAGCDSTYIAWDYHDTIFKKDSAAKYEIAKYVLKSPNRFQLGLTLLNPFFWYKVLHLVGEKNKGPFYSPLVKDYPALESHMPEIIRILNVDAPMHETIQIDSHDGSKAISLSMQQFVEQLHKLGVTNIFASNIRRENLDAVQRLNPSLFENFDFIFHARSDSDEVKPHPKYFKNLRAAINKKYGISNQTPVFFIDDNAHNISGALQANDESSTNFIPVHFESAQQVYNVLKEHGCQFNADVIQAGQQPA